MLSSSNHKEIKGPGSIKIGKKSLPFIFQISYDEYNPEEIKCAIYSNKKHEVFYGELQHILYSTNRREILIKQKNKEIIRISPNSIYEGFDLKTKTKYIKLDCSRFDIGSFLQKHTKKHRIHLTVELTGNDVLSTPDIIEKSYDGNIKRTFPYSKNITWKVKHGEATCLNRFIYQDEIVAKNEANLQIKRPSIFYELNPKKTFDLTELVSEIEEDLDTACMILSLCYRQPVNWYQIEFLVEDKVSKTFLREGLIRKNTTTYSINKKFKDDLINYENLLNPGMDNLFSNFKRLNERYALKRVIQYLSTSYTNQFLENKYFFAFTALDSITENLFEANSQNSSLSNNQWKTLEKELKKSLVKFGAEHNIMDPLLRNIILKIPELRRTPTKEKIVICAEALKIRTDDLWVNSSLREGIQMAIKIRNQLFHGQKLENFGLLYPYLIRLQILTERILLKTLDWPESKTFRWYNSDLRAFPL